MKKKIGVTGASGFVGKLLVKKLVAEGFTVVALTRTKTEFPSSVESITGDLLEPDSLDTFLNSVDAVVHLAARQLPPTEYFFRDNVIATNNLVEKMLLYRINHLVYLSTAAIYADEKNKIYTESDTGNPTTPYGLTKYLSETICRYWEARTQKTLTVLRPSSIYGKENTKGVIYNMVKSIRDKKSVTIYGDGEQKRDFLYVDDVVAAIVLTLKKEQAGTYNLGSGQGSSLLDIVSCFKKIVSPDIAVTFKNAEMGKTTSIAYSVANAQKKLGWKAEVPLVEGLKRCYE